MHSPSVLNECLVPTTEDGQWSHVDAGKLAGLIGVSVAALAASVGLPPDVVMTADGVRSSLAQARLRDLAEILDRILPWSDSPQQAFAWFRSEPLPSFGDRTAEDLAKEGYAEAVKKDIDRIAMGGYA